MVHKDRLSFDWSVTWKSTNNLALSDQQSATVTRINCINSTSVSRISHFFATRIIQPWNSMTAKERTFWKLIATFELFIESASSTHLVSLGFQHYSCWCLVNLYKFCVYDFVRSYVLGVLCGLWVWTLMSVGIAIGLDILSLMFPINTLRVEPER